MSERDEMARWVAEMWSDLGGGRRPDGTANAGETIPISTSTSTRWRQNKLGCTADSKAGTV